MKNLKIMAAVGLLAVGSANAEVSSTLTLANEYDFRGFSQSAKDPALQGSIDYGHDSGWYLGAWASNVDFDNDADIELDLYTGFEGGDSAAFNWAAGLVYYTYPGSEDLDNFPEIFAGAGYGPVSAKLWYSNDLFASDETGYYLEANASMEVMSGFALLAHAGYSWGDYWEDINGDTLIDYSLGVGYQMGAFNLALKYVDTESDVEVSSDIANNEGRVLFTVTTAFPWGD